MKKLVLLGVLVVAGCGISDNLGAIIGVGANVVSVTTIQRSPLDAVYSWWTGRDCSVVRLDEGKTYCRPVEPKPEPPVFCTRGLGGVNCWADPDTVPGHPRGVADGPPRPALPLRPGSRYAHPDGPVAQLDRASPSEGEGRTFESCRVRHFFNRLYDNWECRELPGVTAGVALIAT